MSKDTKRQRKLEEVFSSSSTKKKKSDVDEKNDQPTSSKTTTTTTDSVTKKVSPDDLDVLRQFDLDMTFGPCTGIPRIDRYERALRHDLDPPIRVVEILNLYPNDREVTHCIWRDYTL